MGLNGGWYDPDNTADEYGISGNEGSDVGADTYDTGEAYYETWDGTGLDYIVDTSAISAPVLNIVDQEIDLLLEDTDIDTDMPFEDKLFAFEKELPRIEPGGKKEGDGQSFWSMLGLEGKDKWGALSLVAPMVMGLLKDKGMSEEELLNLKHQQAIEMAKLKASLSGGRGGGGGGAAGPAAFDPQAKVQQVRQGTIKK